MKMWLCSLLACVVVSGCRVDSNTPPASITLVATTEMNQQLQALWERLDKGSSPANKPPMAWTPAYSINFPGEWPPTLTTIWTRYAYARGMDPDLHDAVRVAAPWARVELRRNSATVTIVPLSTKLEPATIQGVSPIDATTQGVLAKENQMSDYGLQLTALPPENSAPLAEMRAFYQTWLKYNGALVDLIRSNHAPFLTWLAS